jgi:hypothetical protein
MRLLSEKTKEIQKRKRNTTTTATRGIKKFGDERQ